MIAPLEMRVPPIAYGGTELVVSLLTEELVRRGHDVTLFASGDSVTCAHLEFICPHHLRGSDRDKGILTMLNVVSCLEEADRFDIIHNHTQFEGLSLAGLVDTPMLTTLHGGLHGDWLELFAHYKGWYCTISRSAKALLPDKDGFAGVIYNAIDVGSYPFRDSPREPFLLFLSRLSPEKGPHIAIQVAKRVHRRLVIAGNVDTVDEEYFRSQVLPEIDGELIQYVGEADYQRKRELLSSAYCLVAPITWDEPFGLFLVESMACGTPVVVFNRGSAPEVVRHGETGFVVNTMPDMAAAVDSIYQISRKRCREHVEENFDVPRMADDYLRAYEHIVAHSAVQPEVTVPSPITAPDGIEALPLGRRDPGHMAISKN
jgi:glycosyltransferase involved in cell wall biosynthesis